MAEKKSKPEKVWKGSVLLPMDLHDEVQKLADAETRSFPKQVAVLLREALLARRSP